MITSVIALLFLFLSVCGLSVLVKRRPEECWPVCYCGTALWLYGFYCLGIVRAGLVLLCVGMLLLFGAGWKKSGSLGKLLKGICTPGNLVYLLFCLLFWLLFSGNIVSRHDELRLWGAVPKAIHATGALQLGQQSPIFSTMQSYPPGLPLVCYYFTAFSKDFSEGALFVGYACMTLSFLAPMFAKWEWKHWHLLAPVALVVLMTPVVFTSHCWDMGMFGMSLYVDAVLGVAAGYGFFLAGKQSARDGFRLVSFSLILGVLCLLKDTGLLFAAAALIVAFALDGKRWKKLLIPGAVMAACTLSWKILLKLYDVHALIPMEMRLLSWEEIKSVLWAMIHYNVIIPDLLPVRILPFAVVFLVLLGLYLLSARLCKGEKRKITLTTAAAIGISTIAFAYGYGLIYAESLDSFARYMETPLLALFTCTLLTVVPCLSETKLMDWALRRSKRIGAAVLCGCVLIGCGAMVIWKFVFPLYWELPYADQDAASIRSAVEQDLEPGETGWVYLVMAGDGWDNSFYHHRIFFDLISANINIRNGMAQTQVVIPGVEKPGQQWAEELKAGCDYVYLLSVEDAFIPVFGEFSEDAPREHGLYRVVPWESGHGIRLELVQ